MLTTPNMSLRVQDQPGDFYSYSDIANDFIALDAHDHTTGKGLQIPTGGIANLAVTAAKIAAGTIDSTKIAAGTITDTNIASPNSSIYRTFAQASGFFSATASGTIYILGNGLAAVPSAVSSSSSNALIPVNSGDFSVAGKTTKLRLSVGWATNATAPAATFSISLHPVTAAGGAGALTLTAGAAVGGAATSVATPAASSVSLVQGGDFTLPANGLYVIGVTPSAAQAANSAVGLTAYLQYRHV